MQRVGCSSRPPRAEAFHAQRVTSAEVNHQLDDAGNSVRAQRAIADISNALGGNPYAAAAGAR